MSNIIQDLGKAGFVLKGNYDASTSYERLDVVGYNGIPYSALQDVPAGHYPVEGGDAYWYQLMQPSGISEDYKNDVAKILSRMVFFVKTKTDSIDIDNIVELVFPDDLKVGVDVFEFLVKIPCDCKGLAIDSSHDANKLINYPSEEHKFNRDDIWHFKLTNSNYEGNRIYKSNRVVYLDGYLEKTQYDKTNPKDRLTIHINTPNFEGLVAEKTYIIKCINPITDIMFKDFCFDNGVKPSRYVGDQANLKFGKNGSGLALQITRPSSSYMVNVSNSKFYFPDFQYEGEINLKFPQLYRSPGDTSEKWISKPTLFYDKKRIDNLTLRLLHLPENTRCTIILYPSVTVQEYGGKKFYWDMNIIFDEFEKVVYFSIPYYTDVTDDNRWDIDDVNAVINVILHKTDDAGIISRADLNNDGVVDIDDMNKVINIILHKYVPSDEERLQGFPLSPLRGDTLKLGQVSLHDNISRTDFEALVDLFNDKELRYCNQDDPEIVFDYSEYVNDDGYITTDYSRNYIINYWQNNNPNVSFNNFALSILNTTIPTSGDEYQFVRHLLLVLADVYEEGIISENAIADCGCNVCGMKNTITGRPLNIYIQDVDDTPEYYVVSNNISGNINANSLSNSTTIVGNTTIGEQISMEINGNH